MEKIKFYYSQPMCAAEVCVISNHRGNFDPANIVGYSKHSMKPLPRITICAVYDEVNNQMKFGIARCNPKDKFCKKIGREISLQNALNPNTAKVYTDVPSKNIGPWRIQICLDLENQIYNCQ